MVREGEVESVESSILDHLIDFEHIIDPKTAFKIIDRTNCKVPRGLRLDQLAIAETRVNLCMQEKIIQPLYLPWD